ncbi:MAG: tetratricopeptide repeat protein [bacterium]|nr:tetratricopeptide repeat protein [bacterium]
MQKKLNNIFDKIIQYGIPVTCFLLAIAFYLKTYDSCMIKITIVQLSGAVFPIIWFIKIIESNNYARIFKDHYYNKLFLPIILVLISNFLSYFFSPFKETSFEELTRRLIYISIFFVIAFEFNTLKRIQRLIFWIIVGALVSSLYGLIQVLGLDPFAWKGAFGPRIFSTFGNPNFFSAYLVWVIPIMLSYVILTRKWMYFCVALISIFCVFWSQSKASWIGLSAALTVFAFLSVRFFAHFNTKNLKKIMIIFITGVLIVSSGAVWYFSTKRIDSVRFRVFTWQSTWEMIREPIFINPLRSQLLGNGIGTFKTVYPKYRKPEIFYIEGKHNTETDHPENEFLEIWYEEGVLGFSIFLWMLFVVIFAAFYKINYVSKTVGAIQRTNRTQEQMEEITLQHYLVGVLAGFMGMLMHSTMCVNLRFVSSGYFFWIQLGLIFAILRAYDKRSINVLIPHKTQRVRILQIALVLLSLLLVKKFVGFFKADYYHNIGIAYSKAKRFKGAAKYYQKVNKLNPSFIMSHYFLANVLMDRGDMNRTYDPKLGDTNNILRNDMERALAKYDDVKHFAPHYVQTHYQVGRAYRRLGDLDKALENFKMAHDLDPIFAGTYLQMGVIYAMQNKEEEAIQTYQELLKIHPKNAEGYFNMGNIYIKQKKLKKSVQAYLKTIEYNKKMFVAYKNLMSIFLNIKDIKKAKDIAKALLEVKPDDQFARSVLAQK